MLDRLDDLSPRIEAVDAGVALVDITGLGPLLGEERRIAARAVALCREVAPLPVRVGAGDNRWLAALAARLARPLRPDAPAAFRAVARRGAGRAATGPAARRSGHAPALRAVRADQHGTAGRRCLVPRSAPSSGSPGSGCSCWPAARTHAPSFRGGDRSELGRRVAFDPPLDGVGAIALALRRACAELCDALRGRHLAPGRARLRLQLEDAPPLGVELAFPAPALEPDWIARLLIGRLEQVARARRLGEAEEPRVTAIGLVFDRLADPATGSCRRSRPRPVAGRSCAGRWSG